MAIVADKYLATTFGFIGIEAFPVENVDEGIGVLDRITSEGGHGVIFISETLAMELKEKRKEVMDSGSPVAFAIIPDFSGPRGSRITEIKDMISQAVGAKLKLGD